MRIAVVVLRLLRAPEVLERRGSGKSLPYDDIRCGLWTPPVRIGSRFSAWPEREVEQLLRARVAGATDASLRALVLELVQARQQGGAP
jgi:prophage regulatory protein